MGNGSRWRGRWCGWLLPLTVWLGVALPAPQIACAEVLTLDDALSRATAANFDLRISHERLQAASTLTGKAWSVLLPVLSGELTGTVYDKKIELEFGGERVPFQNQTRADGNASFNWVLFSGRAFPLLLNAYDAVELEQIDHERRVETIRTATTLAYFNALSTARQIAARERALGTARDHSALAAARVEAGEASSVEALRARTAVAVQEQTLVQLRNASRLAELALAELLGELLGDATPDYTLVGSDAGPLTDEHSEQGKDLLLSRAYDNRLDLRASRLRRVRAERSELESRLGFGPTVAGNGNIAWTDVTGFGGENVTGRSTLAAEWRVFEGGLGYWQLRERRHDTAAAALEVERTRRDIAQQVRAAQLRRESARARQVAATRRVRLARRTAELVAAQYEVGAAIQLELLDADRAVADAETVEALSQLDVDISRVTLEQLMRAPPAGTGGS